MMSLGDVMMIALGDSGDRGEIHRGIARQDAIT